MLAQWKAVVQPRLADQRRWQTEAPGEEMGVVMVCERGLLHQ